MQEILGRKEDILFDLDEIKLLAQKPPKLTAEQQRRLNTLPRAERSEARKAYLKQQEDKRKNDLRRWVIEVEDKIRRMDLPSEVKDRILSLTAYMKERNMKLPYDIDRQMDSIERKIQQAEREKAREQAEQMEKAAAGLTTAVMAGTTLAAVGKYVQVRWDKEEFEHRNKTYYEDRVLTDLASGTVQRRVPPSPVYPTHKSSYGTAHYRLERTQRQEVRDILVRDVQAKQKATGQPVQDSATILANFEKLSPVQRRFAEKNIYAQNPELAAKHRAEQQEVYQRGIEKGIARYRRKQAKRAALQARRAQRQQVAGTPAPVSQTPKKADLKLKLAGGSYKAKMPKAADRDETPQVRASATPEKAPASVATGKAWDRTVVMQSLREQMKLLMKQTTVSRKQAAPSGANLSKETHTPSPSLTQKLAEHSVRAGVRSLTKKLREAQTAFDAPSVRESLRQQAEQLPAKSVARRSKIRSGRPQKSRAA